MKSIRLDDDEIDHIKQAFINVFPKGDKLWIFGSRVYHEKKGGDIDLYIESNVTEPRKIIEMELEFNYQITSYLGDQKIDIVIKSGDYHLPIYDVAIKEGVRLV